MISASHLTVATNPILTVTPMASAPPELESIMSVGELAQARQGGVGWGCTPKQSAGTAGAFTPYDELVNFECVQLVLPNMANHHGNTFGGQIMAWMAEAATVAAKKQALRSALMPHGDMLLHAEIQIIDALQFISKSAVGDRVELRVRVHRVFSSSMEVGVTVAAGHVGGEMRTVNQGFLTVALRATRKLSVSGKQYSLALRPSARPLDEDTAAAEAHNAAMLRLRLRLQRRQMLSLSSDAMIWSYILKDELCICNLLGLLRIAQVGTLRWKVISRITQGVVDKSAEVRHILGGTSGVIVNADTTMSLAVADDLFADGTKSLKVSAIFRTDAHSLFTLVSDIGMRQRWDSIMDEGRVHKRLDENNALIHLKMKSLIPMGKPHDYTMLQSWRRNDDGSYIIASRSIVTEEMPPVRGVRRGAVLPSGFLIEPVDPGAEAEASYQQASRTSFHRSSASKGPPPPKGPGSSSRGPWGSSSAEVLAVDGRPWTRVTYIVQMDSQRGITRSLSGSFLAALVRLMVSRFLNLEATIDATKTPKRRPGSMWAGTKSRIGLRPTTSRPQGSPHRANITDTV